MGVKYQFTFGLIIDVCYVSDYNPLQEATMSDDTEELEEFLEAFPKKGRGHQARPTPSLEIDMPEFERLVESREAQYVNDFEESSITTTDREQLRRLSELSVLAELSNRKAAIMTLGAASPQDIKYVSDAAAKYSSEGRQLATALGVDRKSRVTDQESELETYLPTLHKEAKDFIYKHAIAIVCPHCLNTEARVELRMGTIIYAFSYELRWTWQSICPKCKGEIVITQNNYTKFLFSELDKAGAVQISKDALVDDVSEEDDA